MLRRHLYAVMTEHDLSVWHLNHELDYNLLRGGHTRAVISLYACAGGSVRTPPSHPALTPLFVRPASPRMAEEAVATRRRLQRGQTTATRDTQRSLLRSTF